MSIDFDINFQKLEGDAQVVEFLQKFAAEWTAQAQRLAQVRLKNPGGPYISKFTTELIPSSPPKLRVGNSSAHAIYVEEDTIQHDIEPKPKGRSSFTNPNRPGALRWFDPPGGGKGAAVFAKKVTIPAHKGHHIIEDAVIAAGNELAN